MNAFLTAILNGMAIGVLLALVVGLALRVCHCGLNAATRYNIWWLALLIQIAIPAFLFFSGSVQTATPPARPLILEELPVPRSTGAAAVPYTPVARSALSVAPRVVRSPVAWNPGDWGRRTAIAWSLTSGILLLRLCFSYLALERKKRRAFKPSPELEGAFKKLLARYEIRRRVRILIVPEADAPVADAPVAAGPFCPCVILPQHLLEALEPSELEQVCLHEIAHLARFDDFALILQRVFQAILFFHPAVRWIAGRIHLEREIACDDFVVGATGPPGPYARCLTRVVELCGLAPSQAVSAIGRKSSQLERRIDVLLDETRNAGTRVLRWRFALSSLLLLAAASVGTRAPQFLTLAAQNISAPPVSEAPVPQPTYPLASQVTAPPPFPSATVRTESAERFEVIRVPVSVTDPLHRFVTGMEKSSFRVFDNDTEQPVTGFVSPDAPQSLSIVWDVSERNEASPQVTQLKHDREALLSTYAATHPAVRRMEELISAAQEADKNQASGQELLDFLSRHNPRDRFSLAKVADSSNRYASLREAIRTVGQGDQRSATLIVSNIKWSSNHHPELELRQSLGLHVPLYLIGVGGQFSIGRDTPEESTAILLAEIAKQSGGAQFSVAALTDVLAVASKLVIELHSIYLLDYTRSNGPASKGFHQIHVQLEQPRGLPELSLQHRTGYYTAP